MLDAQKLSWVPLQMLNSPPQKLEPPPKSLITDSNHIERERKTVLKPDPSLFRVFVVQVLVVVVFVVVLTGLPVLASWVVLRLFRLWIVHSNTRRRRKSYPIIIPTNAIYAKKSSTKCDHACHGCYCQSSYVHNLTFDLTSKRRGRKLPFWILRRCIAELLLICTSTINSVTTLRYPGYPGRMDVFEYVRSFWLEIIVLQDEQLVIIRTRVGIPTWKTSPPRAVPKCPIFFVLRLDDASEMKSWFRTFQSCGTTEYSYGLLCTRVLRNTQYSRALSNSLTSSLWVY